MAFKISVKKINITPERKVSLLGYFNERYSKKILDDLYCRILCIQNDSKRILLIQIDTCIVPLSFAVKIRTRAEKLGICNKENLIIYATHTHTAPALDDFFFTKAVVWYRKWLGERINDALDSLSFEEVHSVRVGKISYDDICYNRRWYMKYGWVITNPPGGSKDLLRPEGPVDRELSLLTMYNSKHEPLVIIVNISNHTDTVGQNVISADWPGLLEKLLIEHFKKNLVLFTTLAPQGNINHFDFSNPAHQSGYEVTKKIAEKYFKITLESLSKSRPMEPLPFKSSFKTVKIPPREPDFILPPVPPMQHKKENQQSEKLHTKNANDKTSDNIKSSSNNGYRSEWQIDELKKVIGTLTAEDLARGSEPALKMFSYFKDLFQKKRPESYRVPLQVLKMGKAIFLAIPGEPFVEIGLELKRKLSKNIVFPVSLANGYFGYIPMKEAFKRGGYETQPHPWNCLSVNAAELIVGKLIQLSKQIQKNEIPE